MKKDHSKMATRKIKQRPQVDYSAYHNVQQAWKMKILKYYRQIEDDVDRYVEFGKRLLENKIPKDQLERLDKLMRKHEANKRKEWEARQKNKASPHGLKFRKIYS